MAVGTALAFAAGNIRAQETTQADKDKALAYLESTKKESWTQPKDYPRRSGTSKRLLINGRWRSASSTLPRRRISFAAWRWTRL